MGILKTLVKLKPPGGNEGVSPAHVSPDSGSLNSLDSGAALLPAATTKVINDGATAKKRPPASVKQKMQQRIKNIMWFLAFFTLFLFTVALATILLENFQKASFFKAAPNTSPARHPLPEAGTKGPENENTHEENGFETCIHRRILWRRGSEYSEVIHDFRSKWSAIADHRSGRCLLFDLHDNPVTECPLPYPWDLDQRIGVPVCRGPLAHIAPIRRVMHHVSCENDKNISYSGETITSTCSEYRVFKVDKVVVQFFDRNLRRVARRAVEKLMPAKAVNGSANNSGSPEAGKLGPLSSALFDDDPAWKFLNTSLIKLFGQAEQAGILSKENFQDQAPRVPAKDPLIASTKTSLRNVFRDMVSKLMNKTNLVNRLPIAAEKFDLPEPANNVLGTDKAPIFSPTGTPKPLNESAFWQVVYTAVDEKGNVFEEQTLKDLTQGIKASGSNLLSFKGL